MVEEEVHVLAVPFQAEGHIAGMLGLARALAAMGVVVTFVYPRRSHTLALARGTLADSAENAGTSRLRFEVADDGLPLEEECSLTSELLLISIPIFQKSVELIMGRLVCASPAVSGIISDCVAPWTKGLADAAGLPQIVLWTSTAASFSMSAHLPLLISNGHVPVNNNCWLGSKRWTSEASLVACIPGLPPFPVTDLPSEFAQAETLDDPSLQFLASACEYGRLALCILINSIYELESKVVDALQLQGIAVKTVGPLFYHAVPVRSKHESLTWLDMQPTSSVIYVALGTVSHLTPAEMFALALGLEVSKHLFLWVIRPDEVSAHLSESFPKGFLDHTATKVSGLILPWVPQAEVLGHAAIGSFLSHCGWNSVLESMWEGVPIVACPLGMEQRSNARQIVEHWKMGVELRREVDGRFTKEAVEEALEEVMKESYRKRAEHVQKILRCALQERATSCTNLIELRKLLGYLRSQRASCMGSHSGS